MTTGAPITTCPTCGGDVAADDQFCEACGAVIGTGAGGPAPAAVPANEAGTHLLPPPGADPPSSGAAVTESTAPNAGQRCSCGGAVDADGWCTVCGLRAASERDHTTQQVAPNVAGVCDKGLVHPRNEDAMALAAADGRFVLVVCDGVSSSTDGDVASLAAADAACAVLSHSLPPADTAPDVVVGFWTGAYAQAVDAAQSAAATAALTVGAKENPPSCTFVAAVVDGPVVVAAWIGDSRCYWFGEDGAAIQVSIDDSWASLQVAQGISRADAEADPRAHSITRWLGADAPGGAPTCAALSAAAGGWLLVCSDGLWNYCSEAADLRTLVLDTVAAHDRDPLATASALCDWANQQGGHDNITVTLAHLPATPASVASAPAPAGPAVGADSGSTGPTTAPTEPPA